MSKQIFELDSNAEPCKGEKTFCGSTQCLICLRRLKTIVIGLENQIKFGGDNRLAAKTQGLCYYCKRRGHLAKDCRILQKHRSNEVCGQCNQKGHISKYCQRNDRNDRSHCSSQNRNDSNTKTNTDNNPETNTDNSTN